MTTLAGATSGRRGLLCCGDIHSVYTASLDGDTVNNYVNNTDEDGFSGSMGHMYNKLYIGN